MKTRFAVAACVAALCTVSSVWAQDAFPRNPDEVAKVLGLTAAQKKRIAAIDARYNPQAQTIGRKYQAQVAALQKQMAALQQSYLNDLKPLLAKRGKEVEAVLTPAQRERAKQLDAQLRKRIEAAQKQQLDALKKAQKGAAPAKP